MYTDLNDQIRSRRAPTRRQRLYGVFAPRMVPGEKFHNDMRDRAAYVYVTGLLPSHLRATYTAALRQVCRPYRRPTSLDGRSGHLLLDPEVVTDLHLEHHPMVQEVRRQIRLGCLIQPSRGVGTRRNFNKIFLFRLDAGNRPSAPVTINGDGSRKTGW